MHWYTQLAYGLMRLAARLPLRVFRASGAALGWLFWVTGSRKRRIVEANLNLVRPDLDVAARRRLARECVRETGIALVEVFGIWTNPRRTLARVREVRGQDLFDAAIAAQRGLILCAPHLGSWEVANYWVGARTPFATFYTPPRYPQAEALLRRLRTGGASIQFPIDDSGVRRVFRHLKDGGVVSIMPDHVPRAGGVVAPFFGVPALTMTLLPRLAQRTGAAVLMLFVERLPQGFRVHFREPPAAIRDDDPLAACIAMNAAVEACARDAFTQYQWNYKRFKARAGSGLSDDAYTAAGVRT
ncbi:MAG: lipid A biosynthesis lauroyl acyltransferase [Rhodanobacteraceae bacterium]|jgi:KDO2-lipid IV(A) lauroyltransferase|nr:MAG: lipid A biosynthesis lauroyl acyltransferase [Rhodanobacteraceae bacterium]